MTRTLNIYERIVHHQDEGIINVRVRWTRGIYLFYLSTNVQVRWT
jgi:hypothetical protein